MKLQIPVGPGPFHSDPRPFPRLISSRTQSKPWLPERHALILVTLSLSGPQRSWDANQGGIKRKFRGPEPLTLSLEPKEKKLTNLSSRAQATTKI